jgi:hypothetical protein
MSIEVWAVQLSQGNCFAPTSRALRNSPDTRHCLAHLLVTTSLSGQIVMAVVAADPATQPEMVGAGL